MSNNNINIEKLEKLLPKNNRTKSNKLRSEIGRFSKRKGKTGEHFFATTLSTLTNLQFIRVPNSGAFVGMSNRERLKTLSKVQSLISLGDIITPENLYYYFIFESKNYKNLDFHNLLSVHNSKQLLHWLDELLYDIESAHMYMNHKPIIGFLCIKITNKGNWIVGNMNNVISHFSAFHIPKPHLIFQYTIPQILYDYNFKDDFFICDFVQFVKNNLELFTKQI